MTEDSPICGEGEFRAPPSSSPVPGWKIGRWTLLLLVLLTLAGVSLRLFAPPSFKQAGYDEVVYEAYVKILDKYTLSNYPAIVGYYTKDQNATGSTRLPPTRFLYIFLGYRWHQWFHEPPLESLHSISCLFSILTLPLAAVFAFRLGGERVSAGVLALVAVSPMQIYVSRHALIDGFFGFLALLSLWLLWENLQRPRSIGWLAGYTVSLVLLVITKENAFFVFTAILGILVINRWTRCGTVSPALIPCTLAGGAIGAAILVFLSGGIQECMEAYLSLVKTASHFSYSIQTGDGPWHRYLYDLMLVSPVILLLAIGALFRISSETKPQIYLLSFIALSYVLMCNVRYGMNLRYANMWDMPLRYLAFGQLTALCAHFGRRQTLALIVCMAGLCAYELRMYYVLFVHYNLYELITAALVYALRIVK